MKSGPKLPRPGLPAIANDGHLIEMWVHGKAPLTQALYRREAGTIVAAAGKGIRDLTLDDLQDYQRSIVRLKPSTRATKTGIVKSLLTFAHKVGYVAANASLMLESPKANARVTDRIIEEDDIRRMIELETEDRNNLLLRLLYSSGCRVSEVCSMRLRDFRSRGREGQVTVIGKGSKERTILLSKGIWQRVEPLLDGPEDSFLFSSRQGECLSRCQVTRIVKAAGIRAGLSPKVSSHWLRHSLASHALDNGAPLSLVQATLGHASVATTGRYLHARPTDGASRYVRD